MVTRELTKGITRDITRGIIQPFNYFIFTVKTDNAGTSLSDQFTVPTVSGGTYDAYVDWGDGSAIENITTYNDARWTHTFAGGAGTYEVKIWGTLTRWAFDDSGDEEKYLKTKQVGIFKTKGDKGAFFGCVNHVWEATDAGNLANMLSLFQYFRENTSLVTIPALDKMWTATTTTVATGFFNSAFNDPIISRVNTSSIVSFQNSFWGAFNFNQDISNFNFEAITTTAGLSNFLRDTPFDDDNYDKLLIAMEPQTILAGQTPHFGSAKWKFGFGGQARYDMLSDGTFASVTDGGQEDTTMGCWLNAHNSLKATANPSDGTSLVSTWSDLTDYANDGTATGAQQPVFKTSIANGEPALLFDGVDDRLDIAAASEINDLFSSGGSVFVVFNATTEGEAIGRIFSKYSDTGDTNGGVLYLNDNGVGQGDLVYQKAFSTTNGIWLVENAVTYGNVVIALMTYDASSTSNDPVFYINSKTAATVSENAAPVGTVLSDSTKALTIGNSEGTNRTFDGYIFEIAMWKKILSSQEISDYFDYFAQKYGETLS